MTSRIRLVEKANNEIISRALKDLVFDVQTLTGQVWRLLQYSLQQTYLLRVKLQEMFDIPVENIIIVTIGRS